MVANHIATVRAPTVAFDCKARYDFLLVVHSDTDARSSRNRCGVISCYIECAERQYQQEEQEKRLQVQMWARNISFEIFQIVFFFLGKDFNTYKNEIKQFVLKSQNRLRIRLKMKSTCLK